jgi:ribosomal protein S18 acetylase RimI-like enzyme
VQVEIRTADLGDEKDGAALVAIIDSYARGPGGQNAPLPTEARRRLVSGLRDHPAAFALLALCEGEPVGVAVCVWGFSTFAGRPLLNIHDLAVLPERRGRGIGRRLLAEVDRRARERGACKVTLEVHDTNAGAKRLYASHGFGPWEPPTLFVTKPL